MARVTVEDCVRKIPNRFELILFAAQRARQIQTGAPLLIERQRDRNPVIALREIAGGHISAENMEADIIQKLCRLEPESNADGDSDQTQNNPDEQISEETMVKRLSSFKEPSNPSAPEPKEHKDPFHIQNTQDDQNNA